MEIIPAIDIIDGKCVRLTQGDYAQQKVYNENPLEVAKAFEDGGITRLHLVDLDGAKSGSVQNWKVLERIANNTSLNIDFGGGIANSECVATAINTGAKWVTIGSMAVKQENIFIDWMGEWGADRFLVGADVKGTRLTVSGWLEDTNIEIGDFIEKYMQFGLRQLFCTDISKDGKLEGPSLTLYEKIITQFPELHFIASGGVSDVSDLDALKNIGCKGVIIGKAIYENRITLKQLQDYL